MTLLVDSSLLLKISISMFTLEEFMGTVPDVIVTQELWEALPESPYSGEHNTGGLCRTLSVLRSRHGTTQDFLVRKVRSSSS